MEHTTQSTSSGLGVRRVVKLYITILLHETGDTATALEREPKREKRIESPIRTYHRPPPAGHARDSSTTRAPPAARLPERLWRAEDKDEAACAAVDP